MVDLTYTSKECLRFVGRTSFEAEPWHESRSFKLDILRVSRLLGSDVRMAAVVLFNPREPGAKTASLARPFTCEAFGATCHFEILSPLQLDDSETPASKA